MKPLSQQKVFVNIALANLIKMSMVFITTTVLKARGWFRIYLFRS